MSSHAGHRQRLRTEFEARGLEGWPDHRILELLLFYAIPRGDVNDLAHELVQRFGSLAGVLDASIDELKKVPGIGEHTAVLLKLIPSMGRRYLECRRDLDERVCRVEDAVKVLSPYFFGARNEMVYILALDGKHKVLGVRKIAEGSIFTAEVNIRRIAEETLGLRAAELYLAHNHISNLAFPSKDDWMVTDTVRAVLAGVGLTLVDHIVFVDGDAVSLNESERSGKRNTYHLL